MTNQELTEMCRCFVKQLRHYEGILKDILEYENRLGNRGFSYFAAQRALESDASRAAGVVPPVPSRGTSGAGLAGMHCEAEEEADD